jgi:hydrogenase maturation factor HypE
MGVSIDSLLIILPEKYADDILKFIRSSGSKANIIGFVEAANDKIDSDHNLPKTHRSFGVQLVSDSSKILRPFYSGIGNSENLSPDTNKSAENEFQAQELTPKYREEPYTPIKKVSNVTPQDQESVQKAIEEAMNISLNKKDKLKTWMTSKGRI